jgi:hypothetical protein
MNAISVARKTLASPPTITTNKSTLTEAKKILRKSGRKPNRNNIAEITITILKPERTTI